MYVNQADRIELNYYFFVAPSKYSLSSFISQFNVAVKSKAVVFAVDFNKVNFRILEILKSQGLITDFHFPFLDGEHEKLVDVEVNERSSDLEKMEWFDARQYLKTSLTNHWHTQEYVGDHMVGDKWMVSRYKWCYNFMQKNWLKKEVDLYQLDSIDRFFLHKLFQLYRAVARVSIKRRFILVDDQGTFFSFREVAGMPEEFNWDDYCAGFLKLRRFAASLDGTLQSSFLIPFDLENELEIFQFLRDVLLYWRYDLTEQQLTRITRREEIKPLYFQDVIGLTSHLQRKDKLYIYPKYENGISVIKNFKVYGINDTYEYVSRRELQSLQQMHGFQSFFLVSTPEGIVVSTKAFLESFATQKCKEVLLDGGLLLARIDL